MAVDQEFMYEGSAGPGPGGRKADGRADRRAAEGRKVGWTERADGHVEFLQLLMKTHGGATVFVEVHQF